MTYSPELRESYQNLGDRKPEDILADPERTKAALSEASPSALVQKVAKELAPEDLNNIITQLSTFERARVIMIFKEDFASAIRLFKEVLATCEDKEIRGKSFVNLRLMEKTNLNNTFKRQLTRDI